MSNMKKFLALLLALTMLLAVMVGCSGTVTETQEPEQTAEPPQEQAPEETADAPEPEPEGEAEPEPEELVDEEFTLAESVELPIFEEPFEFSLWTTAGPGGVLVQGSPIMEYLSELTNVYPQLMEMDSMTSSEKFNLMIVSGEYPDAIVGFAQSYQGGTVKAIEDDIIIDMTEVLQESAPNYMAYIQSTPINNKDAYTDDGRMLSMYAFNDEFVLPRGPVVRGDWLEDLGLETPKTVDQYHDVLMAFKDLDQCTYPIFMPAATQHSASIASAYGISGYNMTSGTHFYQVDGTVYSSFLQPEYKEYLQELNRWYTDGLIAKDFYSITDSMGSESESAILQGQVGMWFHMADKIGNYNGRAEDANFHAVALADPTLNEGETLHFYANEGYSLTTNRNISISVQAEDPEGIVKFFDFFFTKQGSDIANYGIEGTSFEYDENGVPQYTELLTNNPEGKTYQQVALSYCWVDIPSIIDRDRSFKSTYTQESQDAIAIYQAESDGAYELPSCMSFTPDESERYAEIINDLETYANETIVRFIIGDYNFDSDWDTFIDTLTMMNIEESVQLKQNALDRYNER